MNNEYQPAGRSALWLAGLVALNGLGAGAAWAAEAAAPGFDPAATDSAPALVSRPVPKPPPAHQALFGAQLRFEFVVDTQGLPGEVTLLEAKATLAATGKIIQESDLASLRQLGLLDGIRANASFKEVNDLITKPFLEPGKQAVLTWRYRPGRKGGVAVATRLTDTVVFQADESESGSQGRRPGQPSSPTPATRPVQPRRSSDNLEPTQPDQAYNPPPTFEPTRPEGSRTITVPGTSQAIVVAIAGGGNTVYTPGQPQSTVVATAGGGSTIYTPGQAPTTVMANAGGGSTIFTPGQPPTTVINTPGGGSTIFTPGQPPTTVVATGGGGSTIFTPGQPPSTVIPIPGGGSTIYTPGQPPVTVMPNQ